MTEQPAAAARLRTSLTSPYGRKARAVIIERGLQASVPVDEVDPWSPDTDLGQDNPIGKVPTLILADGTVLMDSPLVCEFLDVTAPGGPALFPQELPGRVAALRWHALADGIIDAAVTRLLDLRRPAELQWENWRTRQATAIERTGAMLEREADALAAAPFTIGVLTVVVALDYLDLRFAEFAWRDRYPQLAAWYPAVAGRVCLAETLPPDLANRR